jgi:hypothetical protein
VLLHISAGVSVVESDGVGFTVIVKFSAGPVHETELFVKVGVTDTMASTGEFPIFIALNDAIFPVPFAASPMPGLELVHA